jgi:hypothetical protein
MLCILPMDLPSFKVRRIENRYLDMSNIFLILLSLIDHKVGLLLPMLLLHSTCCFGPCTHASFFVSLLPTKCNAKRKMQERQTSSHCVKSSTETRVQNPEQTYAYIRVPTYLLQYSTAVHTFLKFLERPAFHQSRISR